MMKCLWGVLIIAAAAGNAAAAEPCENGSAAGFACSHVDFVGHLSAADMGGSGEALNDVWGWVHAATGVEYALVGMEGGTAFVRVEETGLSFIGRLPASDGGSSIAKGDVPRTAKRCHDELCGEAGSAWRDIKVLGDHAYIVSEAAGHGLQIFDLTELTTATPGTTFETNTATGYYGYYTGIGHAHNLFINEESKRAYIVGHDDPARNVAGGLHILDISDPLHPERLGEVNGDGYTHDVQCVIYRGPDPDIVNPASELCFASNEDTLTVWDVTDPSLPRMLSRTAYPGAAYAHQGWLSDDQRYFFLNDELDESATGARTHLRVFDVSDVDAPRLVADYFAPTLAIDHNNYVHGRWLYQSNYAAGLRILDILDPLHPVEAAYFDTQATDEADFYGTWSNYRFESGHVALSDIEDGLYVVRPTLLESGAAPDLTLALALDDDQAMVGDEVSGELALTLAAATDAVDTRLVLHLPAGAAFGAFTAPEGWQCDDGQRVRECRRAELAGGAEQAFAFTLSAASPAVVDLIAMAYADIADATPADNLASARVNYKAVPGDVGGGGGGGGAAAWLSVVLVSLLFMRIGRRRG